MPVVHSISVHHVIFPNKYYLFQQMENIRLRHHGSDERYFKLHKKCSLYPVGPSLVSVICICRLAPASCGTGISYQKRFTVYSNEISKPKLFSGLVVVPRLQHSDRVWATTYKIISYEQDQSISYDIHHD